MEPRENESTYRVVINQDEQYSIWPEERACPEGWRDAGVRGAKADCLAHIQRVWTDLRPISLQKAMEESDRA